MGLGALAAAALTLQTGGAWALLLAGCVMAVGVTLAPRAQLRERYTQLS